MFTWKYKSFNNFYYCLYTLMISKKEHAYCLESRDWNFEIIMENSLIIFCSMICILSIRDLTFQIFLKTFTENKRLNKKY